MVISYSRLREVCSLKSTKGSVITADELEHSGAVRAAVLAAIFEHAVTHDP